MTKSARNTKEEPGALQQPYLRWALGKDGGASALLGQVVVEGDPDSCRFSYVHRDFPRVLFQKRAEHRMRTRSRIGGRTNIYTEVSRSYSTYKGQKGLASEMPLHHCGRDPYGSKSEEPEHVLESLKTLGSVE